MDVDTGRTRALIDSRLFFVQTLPLLRGRLRNSVLTKKKRENKSYIIYGLSNLKQTNVRCPPKKLCNL